MVDSKQQSHYLDSSGVDPRAKSRTVSEGTPPVWALWSVLIVKAIHSKSPDTQRTLMESINENLQSSSRRSSALVAGALLSCNAKCRSKAVIVEDLRMSTY